MSTAICISCGASKKRAARACSECGLDPSGDDVALAKSHILSIEHYADGNARTRYRGELDAIGARVRNGEKFAFDDTEVARLANLIRHARETPASAHIRMFARVMLTLLPLWLVIGVGVVLLCRRC